MTKFRELKSRADSALIDLLRSVFEEVETDSLKAEVDQLRRGSGDFEPIEQARALSRRTALRTAATGALTGLPSGLAAIASLGADLAFLIYQQFRLILGIATIYGYEPTGRERFHEALACVAYGSGVGIGKRGMAYALEAATAEDGAIAERLGARVLRERLSRFVPFLGAISGGTVNFLVTRAVGEATIRYYENHIDPALADEIWQEGDREHA
jgi:hypothetical protein